MLHRTFIGIASASTAVMVSSLLFAQGADEDDYEVPAAPAPSDAAVPPVAPSAPAPAAPADAAVKELDALRARQIELERRLRALEQAQARPRRAVPEPAKKPSTDPRQLEASAWTRPVPLGLALSGYIQGQYEASALSEDQLQVGGESKNLDRFSVRRARLRIDHGWEHAAAMLELDGNSLRHSLVVLRRAEASLLWRGPAPELPLVMFTLGLFDQPFGYELMESARSRRFAERTQASRAFFPSEPEIGARVYGAAGFFRYGLALVNGMPIEDDRFVDPNANKDIMGRFGVETQPLPELRVAGGLSFLTGKGFHPGSDAQKGVIVWIDENEDGVLQVTEVIGQQSGARRSDNFERWAFGADAQLAFETRLGWTTLSAELVMAKNLDRGLFVADPLISTLDTRELGWYGAIVQDVTRWGFAGFRYDRYDPNSDFLDSQAGKLVPRSQAIETFSPLIGLQLPDEGVRLSFQYDFIRDQLGKDSRGVPTDLDNDQWTLRLQVNL